MSLPDRGTQRLRDHRSSVAGARYFVTECVRSRLPVLRHWATADRARETLGELHDSGDAEISAATIMPDHVPLLFTLGPRLRLGQVLAKFKSFTRDRGRASWHWQEDGFERKLRANDPLEKIGLYIFMNPYRAGLVQPHERWPGWFCPDPLRFEFTRHLQNDAPVPLAWIPQSAEIKASLM